MLLLDIISRWLHILPAVAMVGGTIFMKFAYVPAAAELPGESRAALGEGVRRRWARFVMAGTLGLLVSGLYNAAMASIRYELPPAYNILLLIKIMLALVVFFIAARLTGSSESAKRLRESIDKWLTLNCVLAVTIICLAGVMKVLPREPKVRDETPISQAAYDEESLNLPTISG